MTDKEKTEWLGRYRRALREEKRLCERIKAVRSRREAAACALAGPEGGGEETQRAVAKLAGYQRQLARQLAESERLRQQTEAAIGRLKAPLQRDVLLARYIDGLAWWQVADRLYVSERWAREQHRRGVQALETVPCSSPLGE